MKQDGFTYIDLVSGVAVRKNCDFTEDPGFIRAYTAGVKQANHANFWWILYVTQWAAWHGKQLEGDFVECGTWKGMQAMSSITYTKFHLLKNRKFYLFDTFCGLDPEVSSPEELHEYEGK